MAVHGTMTTGAIDAGLRRRKAEFEELVAKSWHRAYNMAYQLTRDPNDAEDLVQDTYLKAWKAFGSFRPERPFINWILRIMQRAFLDIKRRDNPIRNAESLNNMISPADGEVQEIPIPDTANGPEEMVIAWEVGERVHAALARIPAVYRDAVALCDIQGMSYAEIADIQGTTVGTVRSRIHRGRQMLRKELSKRRIAV